MNQECSSVEHLLCMHEDLGFDPLDCRNKGDQTEKKKAEKNCRSDGKKKAKLKTNQTQYPEFER